MNEKTERELHEEYARINLMGIKERMFSLYDEERCSHTHPYQAELDAIKQELIKRWTSGY